MRKCPVSFYGIAFGLSLFLSSFAQGECTTTAITAINAKYIPMKASLGDATSGFKSLRGPGACAQQYKWGTIVHHENKTYAVHGAIYQRFKAPGELTSFLGFPVTDELTTPDTVGRYNHFQQGSIYWRPCIGAFEVHGLIRNLWAAQSWENGKLGYPKSNELTTPDQVGRYSLFQGGTVYYHPSHGTHAIMGEFLRVWQDKGGLSGLGYPTGKMLCTSLGKCQQPFQNGTLDNLSSEFKERDFRQEIARRGIAIRNQGARGTCSVFTMNFLLEYAYTEMCGTHMNDLSEEYLNHVTNLASNRTDDGDFFHNILAGYNSYGIVREASLPYKSTYMFNGYNLPQTTINEGKSMLASNLKLKSSFLKPIGSTQGLSTAEFNAIIRSLDSGVPVGLGRGHSMPIVGYKWDSNYDGGGYFIFRNSYGVGTGTNGYQLESFGSVKSTANDAIVFERTNN
ncbi:MAG: hypothetical protein HYW48_11930 [Deltaproteobacteria bacterium]|nr:hypothetical protein [Deltaproteobacteria bacterium]